MGFSWYQSRQYRQQAEAQAQLDSIARAEQMVAMALDSVKRAEGLVADGEMAGVKVMNMPAYKDSMLTEARLAEASVYKLSNDKVEIEFTTRGAQPYSVKINDYKTYDSTDLYLIKPEMSQMGISIFAGENINTKDFVFQVAEHNDSTIVMQLPFAEGGYIQQRYVLPKDGYMLQNELSFVNMDGIIPRNVSMFDIDWSVIIPRLEKGYKNEKQYSKLDYYFTGDKKPEEIGRSRDAAKRIDTKVKWFAFQQQFFSAIMTADTEFASADLDVKYFAENDPSRNLMACSAKLRSDFRAGSDNVTVPYTFYFGPNDYSGLKAYDQKYEKIIPLGGWMVGWEHRKGGGRWEKTPEATHLRADSALAERVGGAQASAALVTPTARNALAARAAPGGGPRASSPSSPPPAPPQCRPADLSSPAPVVTWCPPAHAVPS